MKNRILVVEDDRDIRDILLLNLELSGYAYSAFEDGAAALASLDTDCRYDLALLDVMLPGTDGFAMLGPLKSFGIPVIFLTAKADVVSRVHGLRDGAEDTIVKPFEMLELLARVEKVLERSGKAQKQFAYRDLNVDLSARSVTKSGVPIHLQPL